MLYVTRDMLCVPFDIFCSKLCHSRPHNDSVEACTSQTSQVKSIMPDTLALVLCVCVRARAQYGLGIENIHGVAYVASGVMCIGGIASMSSMETSRMGMPIAMMGVSQRHRVYT